MVVEDLYRPYRPKRRTRATIAKEKGLEPLANIILLQMTKRPLEEEAKAFLSEEKESQNGGRCHCSGARDIHGRDISDEADYRIHIRRTDDERRNYHFHSRDEKAVRLRELL